MAARHEESPTTDETQKKVRMDVNGRDRKEICKSSRDGIGTSWFGLIIKLSVE